jgi:hypothetical protein
MLAVLATLAVGMILKRVMFRETRTRYNSVASQCDHPFLHRDETKRVKLIRVTMCHEFHSY